MPLSLCLWVAVILCSLTLSLPSAPPAWPPSWSVGFAVRWCCLVADLSRPSACPRSPGDLLVLGVLFGRCLFLCPPTLSCVCFIFPHILCVGFLFFLDTSAPVLLAPPSGHSLVIHTSMSAPSLAELNLLWDLSCATVRQPCFAYIGALLCDCAGAGRKIRPLGFPRVLRTFELSYVAVL